jgi:rhomboid protease GluP
MTPSNTPPNDQAEPGNEADSNGGYTYSYPRPSQIQPGQPTNTPNQPGYGYGSYNPYDPANQAANTSTANYSQPPYYAPPGQTYMPAQQASYAQPRPQTQRSLALPLHQPTWTNVLLGTIAVVFILEIIKDGSLQGLSEGFSGRTLLDLGALRPSLVKTGQWWRLISVMFLHASIIHILFNGFALYQIGRELEKFYGSARLLLIYFLTGLSGALASMFFGPINEVAVGASGAIFGLFGALAAFYGRNRQQLGRAGMRQFQSVIVLILINLAISATIPNIDNSAHIGGVLGGLVLGYFFSPNYVISQSPNGLPVVEDKSRVQVWAGVAVAFFVLELGALFYFVNR